MRVYLAAPGQMYVLKNRTRIPVSLPVPHLLLSYVQQMQPAKLRMGFERGHRPADYCTDSGAHGWLSDYFRSGKKAPMAAVEKHIKDFLAAVLSMPAKPVFVVELDLQYIYGREVVEGWRRDIWKPFAREHGITVCYVWHPVDGREAWSEMIADPEMLYLGFSGNQSFPLDQRATMVFEAYRAAKRVHGFASVRAEWIKKVPYFSVDSTSWAAGAFFGNAPCFDATTGSMRQHAIGYGAMKKNPKQTIVNAMRAGGKVSIKDLVAQDGSSQNLGPLYLSAVDEYKKFERWFTAYWRARGVDWEQRLADAGIVPGPVRADPAR